MGGSPPPQAVAGRAAAPAAVGEAREQTAVRREGHPADRADAVTEAEGRPLILAIDLLHLHAQQLGRVVAPGRKCHAVLSISIHLMSVSALGSMCNWLKSATIGTEGGT